MIILDTNVVSETLLPAPSSRVVSWLQSQDQLRIYTSAITQAEILFGCEILPAGKRRDRLKAAVEDIFARDLRGRVLPFDEVAAVAYGEIVARRSAMGRPISQSDAMIAAIARVRGATVVTRNIRDFERCGIEVINPWLV